jgi:bacteriocin-like protein
VPTFAPLYSPSEPQPQKAQAFKSNGVAQEVNMKEMAYEELAQVTGGYMAYERNDGGDGDSESRADVLNHGNPVYSGQTCFYSSNSDGTYDYMQGHFTIYPDGWARGKDGSGALGSPTIPENCNPLP